MCNAVDTVLQALSFDQHTPPEGAGEEWRGEAACFQRAVVHLASLMHGVALQHLRGDWDLDNLVEHDHHAPPPANVGHHPCPLKHTGLHTTCTGTYMVQLPAAPTDGQHGTMNGTHKLHECLKLLIASELCLLEIIFVMRRMRNSFRKQTIHATLSTTSCSCVLASPRNSCTTGNPLQIPSFLPCMVFVVLQPLAWMDRNKCVAHSPNSDWV